MNNQSMGDMISTLRKEKGMTQKDLADRLNITDKAVSKWERNLATAMGIAVVVISLLGELDRKSAFTMLGIGLTSMGIYQLGSKD